MSVNTGANASSIANPVHRHAQDVGVGSNITFHDPNNAKRDASPPGAVHTAQQARLAWIGFEGPCFAAPAVFWILYVTAYFGSIRPLDTIFEAGAAHVHAAQMLRYMFLGISILSTITAFLVSVALTEILDALDDAHRDWKADEPRRMNMIKRKLFGSLDEQNGNRDESPGLIRGSFEEWLRVCCCKNSENGPYWCHEQLLKFVSIVGDNDRRAWTENLERRLERGETTHVVKLFHNRASHAAQWTMGVLMAPLALGKFILGNDAHATIMVVMAALLPSVFSHFYDYNPLMLASFARKYLCKTLKRQWCSCRDKTCIVRVISIIGAFVSIVLFVTPLILYYDCDATGGRISSFGCEHNSTLGYDLANAKGVQNIWMIEVWLMPAELLVCISFILIYMRVPLAARNEAEEKRRRSTHDILDLAREANARALTGSADRDSMSSIHSAGQEKQPAQPAKSEGPFMGLITTDIGHMLVDVAQVIAKLVTSAQTALGDILALAITVIVLSVPLLPAFSRADNKNAFTELSAGTDLRPRGIAIIVLNQLFHIFVIYFHSKTNTELGIAPMSKILDDLAKAREERDQTNRKAREERAQANGQRSKDTDRYQRFHQFLEGAKCAFTNIEKTWKTSQPLLLAAFMWFLVSTAAAYGVILDESCEVWSRSLYHTLVGVSAYFGYISLKGIDLVGRFNNNVGADLLDEFDQMAYELLEDSDDQHSKWKSSRRIGGDTSAVEHSQKQWHEDVMFIAAFRPLLVARQQASKLMIDPWRAIGQGTLRNLVIGAFFPIVAIDFVPPDVMEFIGVVLPPFKFLSGLDNSFQC